MTGPLFHWRTVNQRHHAFRAEPTTVGTWQTVCAIWAQGEDIDNEPAPMCDACTNGVLKLCAAEIKAIAEQVDAVADEAWEARKEFLDAAQRVDLAEKNR